MLPDFVAVVLGLLVEAELFAAELFAAELFAAELFAAELFAAELFAAELFAAELFAAELFAEAEFVVEAALFEAELFEAALFTEVEFVVDRSPARAVARDTVGADGLDTGVAVIELRSKVRVAVAGAVSGSPLARADETATWAGSAEEGSAAMEL